MLNDSVGYKLESKPVDYSRQPYIKVADLHGLSDVFSVVEVTESMELHLKGRNDYWYFQPNNSGSIDEIKLLVEFLNGWLEAAEQRQNEG